MGQAAGAADHQSSSNWAWAGNFKRNQADGTRTGPSSKAMFLKLNTQWPQGTNPRSGPAGARHRLRPSTIFRPRRAGVTGYVTSSHGAAAPLRYDVTGHLAGNQSVRSRCRWMNGPTASAARG